jgi:hypothetical protein
MYRARCDAIECKWSLDGFDTRGLRAFRDNYPTGVNFLVVPYVMQSYTKKIAGFPVTIINPADLKVALSK